MMKMNLTLFGEARHHALEPNQSNRKMTLTVKELAEELNINRAMLQEWLNQNSLPQLCPT